MPNRQLTSDGIHATMQALEEGAGGAKVKGSGLVTLRDELGSAAGMVAPAG